MKRVATILLFAIVALMAANCRSAGEVKKKPKLGKSTEFHREPATWIPIFYANYNKRGQDFNERFPSANHVGALGSFGGGLGLFLNTSMSEQWIGHKFFYYYFDVDFSPEYAGSPYPGEKEWVISTYPGIYLRSYLPFWLKFYWGMGTAVRFGAVNYDRWGFYNNFGLEFFGFTGSTIVILHPGQSNIETEYRFGYMWTPFNW